MNGFKFTLLIICSEGALCLLELTTFLNDVLFPQLI